MHSILRRSLYRAVFAGGLLALGAGAVDTASGTDNHHPEPDCADPDVHVLASSTASQTGATLEVTSASASCLGQSQPVISGPQPIAATKRMAYSGMGIWPYFTSVVLVALGMIVLVLRRKPD